MKTFNRLCSIVLAASMLLSQPLTAFAQEPVDSRSGRSVIQEETGDPFEIPIEGITLEESGDSKDAPLTGISLSAKSVSVGKGEKVNLEVQYTPKNATNRDVDWSTSDDKVATVDKTGLVTAVANGNAVITATAKSGGFKATCSVTVSDKAAPNIKKLDFGGNQEVSADKKAPLVGGKKFKLELPQEIPVTAIVENGRIKIGINFKKEQLYSYNSYTGATTTMKSKSTKEQMEDLEKNIKKASAYMGADKWIQMVQEKKFDKAAVPGLTKDVTMDIIGYAEGKWGDSMDNIEGTLIIRLMGSATVQSQYVIWVVPVTVNCKFTAAATLTAKLGYNFKDAKWYGDLGFAIKIGIEPYAGIGFGKVLSGGVYGNATTEVTFTIKSSSKSPGLDKWTIWGEAGIKAYFACMEFKKKLVSTKEYKIYERKDSSRKAVSSAGEEYEDYSWEFCAVGAISELALPAVSEDGTLIEDAYPAANPEIITAGNTTMMLYVKNTLSGNVLDRTDLVYRLYDEKTHQFGDIKTVNTNKTSDSQPVIYTDKNDIYVAWLDSDEDNVLDPDKPMDYMKDFGIRVSKYDSGTDSFVEIGAPAVNENLVYSPELLKTEEGLNLVWVENTDVSTWMAGHIQEDEDTEFVTTSSNIIHRSVLSGDNWVEKDTVPDLDDVSDLTIGQTSSGLEIAYVIDKEESQSLFVRSSDKKTKEIVPEGYITRLSYTDVPSIKGKGTVLTANMDGGLYFLENDKFNGILPPGSMSGDSDYQVYADRIYYLLGEEDKRNVAVSVWDETKESYGSVMLTRENGYVDYFSNQTGTLSYLLTKAKYDEAKEEWVTSSSVKVLDSLDYHDLALLDIDYSPASAYPGLELPFDMCITNNGTDTHVNARYSVTWDGKEIAGDNISLDLLPGESDVAEGGFMVPEDYITKGGDFTVSVKLEGDSNPSNDSQSFSLMKANLTVTAEREVVGSRQYAVIQVENSGLIDTNAVITVTDEDGKTLFTEKGLIRSDDTATFRREYAGKKDQILTVEASGDAEEFYEKNNVDWIEMEESAFDPVDTSPKMLPGELRRLELNKDGRFVYGVKWTVGYPDQKDKGCISLKNGVVTARKNGKATVSANCGPSIATFNITVDDARDQTIPSGNKTLKITAPKSVTLTCDTPDKTKKKKVSVSIPKGLRSDDVTLSYNILKGKEDSFKAFEVTGPVFNNTDRAKASKADFEITPKDAGASYVMWYAKDKDGNEEATAYTKVIVKKANTELAIGEVTDSVSVGEGVNLSVFMTKGNTDTKDPSFSVKGKGFKVSKSGFVAATLPDVSGTVTVRSGKNKMEVQVSSVSRGEEAPFITLNKPFVNVNTPKPSSKKDASLALKLATPKKDKPKVVWSIIEDYHPGVEIDSSGKLTVSKIAEPGVYTVACKAEDEKSGFNTALCEVTLK